MKGLSQKRKKFEKEDIKTDFNIRNTTQTPTKICEGFSNYFK